MIANTRTAADSPHRCKMLAAFVLFAAAVNPCLAANGNIATKAHTAYAIADKSLVDLQRDLDAKKISSAELVQLYLQRIETLDRNGPKLHSIIAINPDALSQARALDDERRTKGARGPMHGIPILLKDNIESADPMPTTAGSLALAQNITGRDAPIVMHLRAAGAIILGKTNLSEWANFRSTHSISGWSAVGGLAKNPFALDRSTCGSSAGSAVAVAAGLAAASVGTETDGSITCPAALNGVVGLKPTAGLLSQERIVPIAHSQDTAGPMGRSVADVALLLDAMVGTSTACPGAKENCPPAHYTAELTPDALRGKRIGVLRFASGRHPEINPVYDHALAILRAAGATLVDVESMDESKIAQDELVVLVTEFKADLNAYLATTPAAVQTRRLDQLIEFNRSSAPELQLFDQEIFLQAQNAAGIDDPVYLLALAESKRLAGAEGISRQLADHQLDLLVAPTTGAAWRIDLVNGDHSLGSFSRRAAVAGYPHLTVPMGEVRGLPLNISFFGPPSSEAMLLAAGFAFESHAHVHLRPQFIPSIDVMP